MGRLTPKQERTGDDSNYAVTYKRDDSWKTEPVESIQFYENGCISFDVDTGVPNGNGNHTYNEQRILSPGAEWVVLEDRFPEGEPE